MDEFFWPYLCVNPLTLDVCESGRNQPISQLEENFPSQSLTSELFAEAMRMPVADFVSQVKDEADINLVALQCSPIRKRKQILVANKEEVSKKLYERDPNSPGNSIEEKRKIIKAKKSKSYRDNVGQKLLKAEEKTAELYQKIQSLQGANLHLKSELVRLRKILQQHGLNY